MEAFSTKKDLTAVFFDIRKAYDCVWQNIILSKLKESNIRGNMISFIKNFLSDRKFSCMVGNSASDWYSLENGVPQGSVISVTLFLLAIDDVIKCTTKKR